MVRPTARWLGALLLGLFALSTPATLRGDEAEFEVAWETRGQALVTELDALATWCHKRKLFRARNQAYEWILLFDPDHATARKWLKYKRSPGGSWSRPAAYSPPRNLAAAKLGEWRTRSAALAGGFVTDGLALLARFETDVPAPRRVRAVATLLQLAPDRPDLREANGEVPQEGGGWLLAESVRTAERRAALAATVERALDPPPKLPAARPTRAENALRVAWTHIVQAPHARVLGAVPADEVLAAARWAEACFPLFEAAFGEPPPVLKDLTIYLLQDAADHRTLLEKHPASSADHRKRVANLNSGWFPKTHQLFALSNSRALRLEWCPRQVVSRLLYRGFGVRSKQGWIVEGLGLYLCRRITGGALTHYVRRTPYQDQTRKRTGDLWERLKDAKADWLAEARTLLGSDDAPELPLVLGKTINTMTAEDVLVSYALSAYLVEGRAQEAPALLLAIGKKKRPPATAVEEVLGVDLETLERRLRRWLDETP